MSSTPYSIEELQKIASGIRGTLVEMSHRAGTPHLSPALSCADILVAAYWNVLEINPAAPYDDARDRFILSKGHAASVLYAVLAERGFFPKTLLDNFAQEGSPLAEQPSPNCAPGVELATGSLGHGLPVGIGMAMAARIRKLDYRVFVTMGDGECNEGSVWEGAMFAAAQGLGKLTVIIDYNKWQATGRSDEVMALPSLCAKWAAFGWKAVEVNGHDIQALTDAMNLAGSGNQPIAIIAHTVKGKGISFMEDDNNWHYLIPTEKQVAAARKELGLS